MKTLLKIILVLGIVIFGISRGWHTKAANVADKLQPVSEKIVDSTEKLIKKGIE